MLGAALWIGVAAPALGGCAPPTQAKLPPPWPAAAEARRATYDDYQLTKIHNTDPPRWKRADGAYTADELSNVFEAYPNTTDTKNRAEKRVNTFVGLAGLGDSTGFVVGTVCDGGAACMWSSRPGAASSGTSPLMLRT